MMDTMPGHRVRVEASKHRIETIERLELLAEHDAEADALFERCSAALPGVACSWRDG